MPPPDAYLAKGDLRGVWGKLEIHRGSSRHHGWSNPIGTGGKYRHTFERGTPNTIVRQVLSLQVRLKDKLGIVASAADHCSFDH